MSETNDVDALVMRIKEKVTKDQIEKYISYAELEAGPVCCDEWFDDISNFLRATAQTADCLCGARNIRCSSDDTREIEAGDSYKQT